MREASKLPMSYNYSYDGSIFESDYIVIFTQSDGFTTRGMSADLLVNSDYTYQLEISSGESQVSTEEDFYIFISGKLPKSMKFKIGFLISPITNKFDVSPSQGVFYDDISTTGIKIKRKDKIIDAFFGVIKDEKKYCKQANEAEIKLFNLTNELVDWVNKIYEIHLNL